MNLVQRFKWGVVFSSILGKIFYQTKPSLTLGFASGDWTHVHRGDSGVGWGEEGLERHQARGKRIEGFGVIQTRLESHFGHLAVWPWKVT